MQHTPDVDVIISFRIENQKREAPKLPMPQPHQIQFMSVARRTRCRMPADVCIGMLQCINEAQSNRGVSLSQVIQDCFIDVLMGELARYDRLGLPPFARRLTRLRRASK